MTRIAGIITLLFLCPLMVAGVAYAQETPSGTTAKILRSELLALDNQVQALQKTAADINRDLTILEEEAQFPERSRIAVFLSMGQMLHFDLDSVELSVNGKIVTTHTYTPEETAALQLGGIHRLYIGSLNDGEQFLSAIFKGKTPANPLYRSSASLNFKKGQKPKFIALSISDLLQDNTPAMTVREAQ
ncbi:MAG: AraC family transcriptional regulator [Gammaproteobacteria bacterium]